MAAAFDTEKFRLRRFVDRLVAMGEVEVRDETTPDVVRDLVVDLGLGLVRMQERHHRIEDVFREGGAGSVQPV